MQNHPTICMYQCTTLSNKLKNNQVNVEKQFTPTAELKPHVARRYRAETAIYKVETFITFPSRPTDTSSTVQLHA